MSFPDASTTGVRDGVTLTASGGFTVNTAGAVISGLNITGNVVINAPNVTLVDCRVNGNITVQSTGATIEYVDVVGRNSLNTVYIGGDNTTLRFCDVSGSENGIWLQADGVVIEENYIHNLFSNTGSSDPHIDGIQIPGNNIGAPPTENVIIRHNNFDLPGVNTNASITMRDSINIDIIDNRLSGGSYVIYFDGASRDCDVVNNAFDWFGFGYIAGNSWDDQTYNGNIDEDTGELLPFNDDGAAIAGSISINDVTISEGNSGTKVATFTVTRSGGTAAFDVNYATSNGTATAADGDYAAASNTLHFGANENTKTVSVTINGDAKVEANETFNVNLSSATNGATISDSRGIGTITNDDANEAPPPPPNTGLVLHVSGDQYQGAPHFNVSVDGQVVATDLVATGNHSLGQWTDVTVAGDFSRASQVDVTFTNDAFGGSATTDRNLYVDYIEVAGQRYEGETVGVHTADPNAAVLFGNGTLSFTINTGSTPSVSINDVTISEDNSGTKVATFTVTRSGGTAAFDVNYATSNGTATVADGDYVAASNTLHFGANQNMQTISVAINGDTKVETNETFNVVLSNTTNGATISDGQGIGTITNDDANEAPPPPPNTGLVLHVSGDQYQGAPHFNVSVDGQVVATDLVATGNHSLGQWTDVTVAGDFSRASQVDVTFTNDAFGGSATTDRNLYVDYIEVAGQRYEGETVGVHTADPNAAVLFGNGALSFTINTGSTPSETPTFSGSDFTGSNSADTIIGNDLDNRIIGRGGNDVIKGGVGDDYISGGSGSDQLWGGSGSDQFFFWSEASANGDQIMDFAKGDVIDLSAIDSNEAFWFVGTEAFIGAGQLHFKQDAANGLTYIEGNTNGDPSPDFVITVSGLHTLAATDFLL